MDQKKNHIHAHDTNPRTRSGFNSLTKTFHTLRPPIDLPPQDLPLSAAEYAFSLRRNLPWPDSVALIDSATGDRVLYSDFARRTQTLAANLRTLVGLSKGDTAFVLSANSVRVPILYFALLSLGVVISPVNPISTESEIVRLIQLCNPVVAFATSSTAHKVRRLFSIRKVLIIDSLEFESMMMMRRNNQSEREEVIIKQSDLAAIMYSSGTTGKVKGVMTTHRNLIAMVAGYNLNRAERESPAVVLYMVPYFHMYGFFYCVKAVVAGDAVVVMERFGMEKMLRAVEEFSVTSLALVPPMVVAMVKNHSTAAYNLSSLETVACGAAPLSKDVITAFNAKFPKIFLLQGYGTTEASGAVCRMVHPEESSKSGSSGRLIECLEAKIVDTETGEALPPCKQGELWIRGPSVMKGYIGDTNATSAAIVEGGWLRTGDLCYFDEEGFLYVVDRLKELIKYNAYQVAPAELEQLLQSHPGILDAAVIPYPDEDAGQIPMAIVVRQPKSILGEAEVMDFVAKQVAPYKKIRRVAFADSIPKTASGKILRRELSKIFVPLSFSRL